MNRYVVTKTVVVEYYLTVLAKSEKQAIKKAQEEEERSGPTCWSDYNWVNTSEPLTAELVKESYVKEVQTQ